MKAAAAGMDEYMNARDGLLVKSMDIIWMDYMSL